MTSLAVCVALLWTALARADVLIGTLKSVDADKNTVTMTTADKAEKTFEMDAEARVFRIVGTGKKAKAEDIAGGLKGLTPGASVTVFTETKNKKDVVTQIKVEGTAKK
jgi:Cu/Ag efflux protein CusF